MFRAVSRVGIYTNAARFLSDVPKPSSTIFLMNLPYSLGWSDIKDALEQDYNLKPTFVKPIVDEEGKSRGIATATFASVDEAADALAALKDGYLGGRPVFARFNTSAKKLRPELIVRLDKQGLVIEDWKNIRELCVAKGCEPSFVRIHDIDGDSYANIHYPSIEAANHAIEILSQYESEFGGAIGTFRE